MEKIVEHITPTTSQVKVTADQSPVKLSDIEPLLQNVFRVPPITKKVPQAPTFGSRLQAAFG